MRAICDAFITPRNQLHLRGHPYVLDKLRYFNVVRRNLFST